MVGDVIVDASMMSSPAPPVMAIACGADGTVEADRARKAGDLQSAVRQPDLDLIVAVGAGELGRLAELRPAARLASRRRPWRPG